MTNTSKRGRISCARTKDLPPSNDEKLKTISPASIGGYLKKDKRACKLPG
jgi:hypothetical protein